MLNTETTMNRISANSNKAKTTNILFLSLKKGLAWVGIASLMVGGTTAGIWALIPTTLLPWGASHVNLIGYISHCSFAPISSLLLFGLTIIGVLLARKRTDMKHNGLIVTGFGVAGVIIGALNTISTNMLVLGFFGVVLGMIFVVGIEIFMTRFSQKRMENDFKLQT